MLKKILKTDFIFLTFIKYLLLFGYAQGEDTNNKVVSFDLLNKLSAKKHRIEIPLGTAYVIQDIRIVPRSCKKIKDVLYKVDSDVAHVEIFMEQEELEDENQGESYQPIILYKKDLTNNIRLPNPPMEHPLYDLFLVRCD